MTEKIAVIPGDGVGPEVIKQGKKVLKKIEQKTDLELEFTEFPLGADHYLETGELLTDEIKEEMSKNDAIYMGAVGDPRVEPGILEEGILLELRFAFDQYINLRPIRLHNKNLTPIKNKENNEINITVIRENTEGLYSRSGGFLKKGTKDEVAVQEMINTRKGVERIIKYAYEYVKNHKQPKKLTLCDKSNVLTYAHDLWQRVYSEVGQQYDIKTDHVLVDAMTMELIRNPEKFDVIVTCNMFGDIITDLGAELQGGMGLAASANINPNGISMFEPVHGTAPDIAGKNIANPIASISAAKMMIKHLGYKKESKIIEKAIQKTLKSNTYTPDLGGNYKTNEVGNKIIENIEKEHQKNK